MSTGHKTPPPTKTVVKTTDELRKLLIKVASDNIGKKVGIRGECSDLPLTPLSEAKAMTPLDFDPSGRDQDYKWGKLIALKDASPGDILQFSAFKQTITTDTTIELAFPGDTSPSHWTLTNETFLDRGHHTAILKAPVKIGQYAVWEQNVERIKGFGKDKTVGEAKFYVPDVVFLETRKRGRVTITAELGKNLKKYWGPAGHAKVDELLKKFMGKTFDTSIVIKTRGKFEGSVKAYQPLPKSAPLPNPNAGPQSNPKPIPKSSPTPTPTLHSSRTS